MQAFTIVKHLGSGSFGQALLVATKAPPHRHYVVKRIQLHSMDAKDRQDALKEAQVCVQQVVWGVVCPEKLCWMSPCHHACFSPLPDLAQLLKRLRHENIIGYFASFIEDESLHIVLEYADGGDLSQVIKAKRAKGESFSEKQIMWWFVQLCLSMAYLHNDMRVLHRDLKTQNIFLTQGRQVVKLGDFGIAKVLADTGTMKSMAKSVIGTPFYMSPELCEGKPYNHKSDVWALGCVLYEMATLKHAFDSNSLGALVLKILRGNYPPIDAEKYSANLRGLVDWMLKADPTDRPSVLQIVQTSWVNRLIKWFRNETSTGNPKADVALVSETIRRGASGQQIAAAAAATGASERLLEPPSPAVQQQPQPAALQRASLASSRASSSSRDKDQGSWSAPGAAAEREERAERQRSKHGYRPIKAASSRGVHRTSSSSRPLSGQGSGIAISSDRRMPPQPRGGVQGGAPSSRRGSAMSDDGRELYPGMPAASSAHADPSPPMGDPSVASYNGYYARDTAHGSASPPPPRVPHPSAASTAAATDVHHQQGHQSSPHSLGASGESSSSAAAGGTGSSHGSSPLKRGLRQVPERRSVPRPGSFSAMYNTSSIAAVPSPSPIPAASDGADGGRQQYGFAGDAARGSAGAEGSHATPATSPVHVHPATKRPLPPPPTAPPPTLSKADATPPSRSSSRRSSAQQQFMHTGATSDMDTLSSADASTFSSGALRSRLDDALAGHAAASEHSALSEQAAHSTHLGSSRASAASAASGHSLGARRGQRGQGLHVETSTSAGATLPADADLAGISPSRPQIAGGGDVGNISQRVSDSTAASEANMLSWRHNTLAFGDEGEATPGQGQGQAGAFVSPLNQARRRSGSSSLAGSPEFGAALASGKWPAGMNTPTTRSARSASMASATPGAGAQSPWEMEPQAERRSTAGGEALRPQGRSAPQLHLAIDSPATVNGGSSQGSSTSAPAAASAPTAPRGPAGHRAVVGEVQSDDGVSSSSPSTQQGVSSLQDSGSMQFQRYGRSANTSGHTRHTSAGADGSTSEGDLSPNSHVADSAASDRLSPDGTSAEWEAAEEEAEAEGDEGGFREYDEYGRAVYYDAAFDDMGQPLLDENGDQMYHEYLVDASQAFDFELQAAAEYEQGGDSSYSDDEMDDEQEFLQATVDAAVLQEADDHSQSSHSESGSEGGPSDSDEYAGGRKRRGGGGQAHPVPTYDAELHHAQSGVGARVSAAQAPPAQQEDEFPGDFVHVSGGTRLPRMSVVRRSAHGSAASSVASAASSSDGAVAAEVATTPSRRIIRRSQSDEVSPVALRAAARSGRLSQEQKAAQAARLRIVDEMATGGATRRTGFLRRGVSDEVQPSEARHLADLSERSSVASDATGTENTPSARAAAALRDSFGPGSAGGGTHPFEGTLSMGRSQGHRRATLDMRPPPVPAAAAANGARRRSDGVVSGLVHKFERMSSQRVELGQPPAGEAMEGRARRSSSLSARDTVQEGVDNVARSLETSGSFSGAQALVSSWKRAQMGQAGPQRESAAGDLQPARRPERSLPSELKASLPSVQLQLPLPEDEQDTPVVTFVPARSRSSSSLSLATSTVQASTTTAHAVYLSKTTTTATPAAEERRLPSSSASLGLPAAARQQGGQKAASASAHVQGAAGSSMVSTAGSLTHDRSAHPTSAGTHTHSVADATQSTSVSPMGRSGVQSGSGQGARKQAGVSPLLAPSRAPAGNQQHSAHDEMDDFALSSGTSRGAAYSAASTRRGSTLGGASTGVSRAEHRDTFGSPMGTTGGDSSVSTSTRRRASSSDDPGTLRDRVAALRSSCRAALGEEVFHRLHAALAASGDGESGLDALAEVDTGTVTVDLVVLAKISKLLRLEDQLEDAQMMERGAE